MGKVKESKLKTKAPAAKPLAAKSAGVTKPSQTPVAKSKKMAKEIATKAVTKEDKKKKAKVEISSDSESGSDDPSSEDDSASSDSDSEEETVVKVVAITNGKAKKAAKAPESDSDSGSDSSDSSEDDSASSDSESVHEETKVKKVAVTNGKAKKAAKAPESDSDSGSDSSDSDESDSASDSEEETKAEPAKAKAVNGKAAKAEEKSDDSDSEEDSDDSSDSSDDDDEEKAKAEAPSKKRKADDEAATPAKKSKTEDDAAEEKPSTLFVGNLSWNVDDAMLSEEFKLSGNVVSARVITDRNDGRSKGFGYVDFATPADAEKAYNEKQGAYIDGRAIKVDFSTGKANDTTNSPANRAKKFGDVTSPESDTLFVGNLPFDADEDAVGAFFAEVAEVKSLRLPTDQDSGRRKGFGYVSFHSIEDAKTAFSQLNGGSINGRACRLDYSQPRAPREGGGFGGGRGGRGGGRGGFGGRGGGGGGFGGGRGGGRGGFGGGRGGGRGGGFQGKKITF